jgi:hypothetical protein
MSGTNSQFLYLLTNQSLLRVAVSGGPKTKAFFFWKQRAFSSGVKAVEVQQRVVEGLKGAEVLWKVWGGQWKVY